VYKKTIDPLSARLSAVPLKDCVYCEVDNGNDLDHPYSLQNGERTIEIPKHKKNLELGNRKLILSSEILLSQEDAKILQKDEEFTLINWGNAVVVHKEEIDGKVLSLKLKLNLRGDFKTTKNKISWISRKGSFNVKLYEYGNLQNDLDTDDLHQKFNVNSKMEEWWIMESSGFDIKETETIQIERIGFFICDKPYEFNLIPFTKQKRTE
jgi:glutamyl-tRNA synthetase